MKRWEVIAFLLLCLAVVVFVSGCSSTKLEEGSLAWVKDQERKKLYTAIHDCMSAYRSQRWPNVVIFAPGEHPCIKCAQGSAKACSEVQ